jgi:hypothetical protein
MRRQPMPYRIVALCLFATALVAAPACARAEDDAVQFFNNINVTPDAPVQDAVCFFCSVHVDGKVNGDIVVFFGNVRLSGQAQGDIVTFFGNVNAASDSSVNGDLVTFFGPVELGENVKVGGDLVTIFGPSHTASSVAIGGDHVGLSPWIFFGPLGVIFLIVYIIVHEIRSRRMRMAGMPPYPMPPFPPPPAPPQR